MGRTISPEEAASLGLEDGPSASPASPTASAPPPERQKMSKLKAALAAIQQGGALGWGDELGAALQGGLTKATGGDYLPAYRQALAENRAEVAQAKQDQAWVYYPAEIAASLPATALMPGVKAGQGASLLRRALTSGANGVMQGATYGAGVSNADTGEGVAKDAAIGGGLGGTVGAALPVVGDSARAAGGMLLRGALQVAPQVQRLREMGVDTSRFTLGQQTPGSRIADLEEMASVGSTVRGQRNVGVRAWQKGTAKQAFPEGSEPAEGTMSEMLDAAHDARNAAYEQYHVPIRTAGAGEQSMADQLRRGFAEAAADRDVMADPQLRATIADGLDNLAGKMQFEPGSQGNTSGLINVRSHIRKLIRAADMKGDNEKADLLRNAERQVTDHIARNLELAPIEAPEGAEGLRMLDAAHRRAMVLEKANAKAGEPVGDQSSGMMPSYLETSVRQTTPEGIYARGGGGDLRELAALGKYALETKTPPTGVRSLLAPIPYADKLTSPLIGIANTGPIKRMILGQTPAQQRVLALIEALRNGAPSLSGTLERRLNTPTGSLLLPLSEATSQ